MGHCRASLIKPKQCGKSSSVGAMDDERRGAAGGFVKYGSNQSLAAGIQTRSSAHLKATNQALDVPRTLAMVVAVMASRSESRPASNSSLARSLIYRSI